MCAQRAVSCLRRPRAASIAICCWFGVAGSAPANCKGCAVFDTSKQGAAAHKLIVDAIAQRAAGGRRAPRGVGAAQRRKVEAARDDLDRLGVGEGGGGRGLLGAARREMGVVRCERRARAGGRGCLALSPTAALTSSKSS